MNEFRAPENITINEELPSIAEADFDTVFVALLEPERQDFRIHRWVGKMEMTRLLRASDMGLFRCGSRVCLSFQCANGPAQQDHIECARDRSACKVLLAHEQ